MQPRPLLQHDQRVLELAELLGIDAEVAMQRQFDRRAGRHIDECSSRPDSCVQRGKLVVCGRNDCAEILAHQVWIVAQR
jgi:hypothetical protein